MLIHLEQGEYRAAALIADHLSLDQETRSFIASLGGKEAVETKSGIHTANLEQRALWASLGGKVFSGSKWYTNGNEQKRAFSAPGPGWHTGRLLNKKKRRTGYTIGKFWNDGVENKRSEICPGPEWKQSTLLNEEQRKRRSEIAKEVCRKRWQEN